MMKPETFQKLVYTHYKARGRHSLPWRPPALAVKKDGSVDPYKIVVSEIMLQQTQIVRVLPKYKLWMQMYPNVTVLADAQLKDVLLLWQGLGYSRRAKALWILANKVSGELRGIFPRTEKELIDLPGIGEYTANAILAFAFDRSATLVETNIRTAIIHHFFSDTKDVSDSAIKEVLKKIEDKKKPREWYYALMDYGAYLKELGISHNAKSKHYNKQTKFEGSTRQVRGEILKALGQGTMTEQALIKHLAHRKKNIVEQKIAELLKEKLISKKGRQLLLG